MVVILQSFAHNNEKEIVIKCNNHCINCLRCVYMWHVVIKLPFVTFIIYNIMCIIIDTQELMVS